MPTLNVTFDAQALGEEEFVQLVQGGIVLSAAGLLNLKWEDFSALESARKIGLTDVVWDAVRDDTPGTLTCIILYHTASLPELQTRLVSQTVLEYELHADRCDLTTDRNG